MTYVDISLLRDSIELTPGRQKLVASQVLEKMTPEERTLFGAAAEAAMAQADQAERLSATRRAEEPKVYGEAARSEDISADAVLALCFNILEGTARAYSGSTDVGAAARRLLSSFFPHGHQAISQARYAEELIQLERIVSDGASAALAPSVALVPGLAPALAELGTRTRAYRVALDRDARPGVSYQDARSAADAGDRRLTELVAKVLAHYSGDEEANMKRRTELLEPYVVLMNDLRDRYRRRLPPGDIDSATGALVGGDVAASIAAESVAKAPIR